MNDLEFARIVYTRLLDNCPTRKLIFARGGLHRFEGPTWRRIPEDDIGRTIIGVGMELTSQATKGFTYNDGRLRSVWKTIERQASQPTFFDVGAQTSFLDGTFMTLDKGDIRMEGKFEIRQATAEDRITWTLPVAYDAAATCPHWQKTLEEWLPDPELRRLAQDVFGLCLAQLGPKLQRFVLLLGPPASGKSQFLSVLQALFPPEVVTAIYPNSFTNQFALAQLMGSVLNVAPDLSVDQVSAAMLSAVVDGAPLQVQRKYRDPVTFQPRCTHVWSSNTAPSPDDFTGGLWRRAVILPFEQVKPEGERIPDLAKRLVAEELPGIALWALEGAARVLREGLVIPAASAASAELWRRETDQAAAFLHASYIIDSYSRIRLPEIMATYATWAGLHGHKPLSSISLARRLRSLGVPYFNDGKHGTWGLILLPKDEM